MPLYPASNPTYVNVKDYKAVGDGVNDDTTAIQNAIAAVSSGGGIVVFPFGTYKITSSLIVDADNVALVGFGQRTSSPTIQVASTADPSYALICGNTKNINSCYIGGLAFVGRGNTTSTGKGIFLRSLSGKISQTKVALFGGDGVTLDSFSGTNFENFLIDIDLVQNGMNTTTPGDNLVINGGVSDCEYHRVISQGDAGKSTTRNGIAINGAGNQKLVDCHAYFCKNDGLHIVSGVNCQVIGGEWETNTVNGIESGGINLFVCGATCFANGNVDIATYAPAKIIGCSLSSASNDNIYVNSSSGGIISGNTCSGCFTAIQLDTGASAYIVSDNICSATTTNVIATKSTNSNIYGNTVSGGGNVVEQTGAQGNSIHDNILIGGGTITRVGTTTRLKNNFGFNPVGHISSPTLPATTVAYTNILGSDCTVAITGGTVTAIAIGGIATGLTSGMFRVPVGQTITVTYSVAPTWTWWGD